MQALLAMGSRPMGFRSIFPQFRIAAEDFGYLELVGYAQAAWGLTNVSVERADQAFELMTRIYDSGVRAALAAHEEGMHAEAAADAAQQALVHAGDRLAALEVERTARLPDLRAQLVDVYKRGRSGYARLIFGASDLRDFARATRAVAALASINERRVAEYQRTLQDLTAERAALDRSATELNAREAEARLARAAADRAAPDRHARRRTPPPAARRPGPGAWRTA